MLQVRTYSSRCVVFSLQYTYVHQQQVHAVRTSVGEIRGYIMQVHQVPGTYLLGSSTFQKKKIYIRTHISSAVPTYSSTQYVLHRSRCSTCAYNRYYSSRYGTNVNTAICTSVGVVHNMRSYSNRCSGRFSRYVRDLIAETWERHRLWGIKYRCLLTRILQLHQLLRIHRPM